MTRRDRLIIAVTGTPGTGKTRFAMDAARALGGRAKIVEINDVVGRRHTFSRVDRFGTRIVNLGELKRAMRLEILGAHEDMVIVVGHLAPELGFRYDVAIVTRCSLRTLAARLSKRKYPREKIAENIGAEALDYCGRNVSAVRTYEVESALDKKAMIKHLGELCSGRHGGAPKQKRIDKFTELKDMIGKRNRYGL